MIEEYDALKQTIERDCRVLESFRIMDYSMLLGVHNLDRAKSSDVVRRVLFPVLPQICRFHFCVALLVAALSVVFAFFHVKFSRERKRKFLGNFQTFSLFFGRA